MPLSVDMDMGNRPSFARAAELVNDGPVTIVLEAGP